MHFEELLKQDFLNLPFIQSGNLTFKEYFNSKLDAYLNHLEILDESSLKIPLLKATKLKIIERQKELINGLKNSMDLFLEGYPSKAFEILKETIENRLKKYRNMLEIKTYEKGDDFYRIRKNDENLILNSENFFHIPFQYRGSVKNHRYSISGFPSLYLGKTIYVCWEELNRPNIHEFYAVRLQLQNSIKLINLIPPFFEDNLNQIKFYKYLMTWPLIFACNIRVKNIKNYFKPEYIIPQLLLEWIRDNENIDGIQYWSTHVDKIPLVFKGELYNLVLPIKKSKDSGLCDELCKKFKATEVISWQTKEFATGAESFLAGKKYYEKTNLKMDYLELIKGKQNPYGYSVFGDMETFFDGMDLNIINPS